MLKKIKEFRKYIIGFLIGSGLLVGVTALALQVSQTGTGLTNVPNGAMLSGSTTNQTLVVTPIGSNGYVWTSNGTIPSWQPATGGGTGSITTSTPAQIGKSANWTGLSTLGNGILWDNGTVAGVGATSSTINFNIQGSGTNDPLNVSSSSGVSILRVTSNQRVGINSSTPAATLGITGVGGINPLIIASSTGTVLVTVDQSGNLLAPNGVVSGAALQTTGGCIKDGGGTNRFCIGDPNQFTAGSVLGPQEDNKWFSVGSSSTPFSFATIQENSGSTLNRPIFNVATSSGASYFLVTRTGNTGIGSTTPGSKLLVQGDAGTNDIFNTASSTGRSIFKVKANNSTVVGVDASTTAFSNASVGGITTASTTPVLQLGPQAMSSTELANSQGGTASGVYLGANSTTHNFQGDFINFQNDNYLFGGTPTTIFQVSFNGTLKMKSGSFQNSGLQVSFASSLAHVQFSNNGADFYTNNGGGYSFQGQINPYSNPLSSLNFMEVKPTLSMFAVSSSTISGLGVIPDFRGFNGNNFGGQFIGANIAPNIGNAADRFTTSTVPQIALQVAPILNYATTSLTAYVGLNINITETLIPTSTAINNYIIKAGTSTNQSMFVLTNKGRVGIGSSTPNYGFVANSTVAAPNLTAFATGDSAVCLRAGGEITVDSGVSSCIVSSIFTKNNITDRDYQEAQDRINQLRVVTFTYNDSGKKDIGLLAEEVAKIDPRYAQYTTAEKDVDGHHYKIGDPIAINWSAITADMVLVMQHQQTPVTKQNGVWLVLGLLAIGFVYQQVRINQLKK